MGFPPPKSYTEATGTISTLKLLVSETYNIISFFEIIKSIDCANYEENLRNIRIVS